MSTSRVRRRVQGERHLLGPWHCVDIFVFPPSSRAKVFSSSSMVEIDAREGLPSIFLPNTPALAYSSGPVFSQGAAARLDILIARVKRAVMTALRFLHCAFYGVDDDSGLDSRLRTHDRVLMDLPCAAVADNDELGLLHVYGEQSLTLRRPPLLSSAFVTWTGPLWFLL